ncbi:HAD-IA family hydrolase, partial [Bacillus amyloliquefaciens]|nr:HAD-IA family hydrolase [Bacillus amyloliquefaciens]
DEKLVKPDPAIFRLALDRFGLRAEQAYFVDDNAANVAAAQALGIRSHLFRGAEPLRAEIVALGLLDQNARASAATSASTLG